MLSGVGVYISRVEEGSVAERAGLRPGDSILEVNGTPFTGISHEEALKVCVFVMRLPLSVEATLQEDYYSRKNIEMSNVCSFCSRPTYDA